MRGQRNKNRAGGKASCNKGAAIPVWETDSGSGFLPVARLPGGDKGREGVLTWDYGNVPQGLLVAVFTVLIPHTGGSAPRQPFPSPLCLLPGLGLVDGRI